MIINAHTQSLWLLGQPVTQTVSPGLFNTAFARSGDNMAMHALDVQSDQLPIALQLFRHCANVQGCLLTIPHKLPAVQHMDVLSERSQALGLVNIIRKTAQGLEGDALDGQGLMGALAQHNIDVEGQVVLIIGCGGAGAACAWDALVAGAEHVFVYDLNHARSAQLAQTLASRFGPTRVQILTDLNAFREDTQIVLNASPLGMRANDPLPMVLEFLPPSAVLVDATTPPQTSRWLTEGAVRGHRVIHGPEFTRGQVVAMARFFKLSERLTAALAQA
jgi:shikimate dehydrogenase